MERDAALEVTASITDVCLHLRYLITVSSASAEIKDVISMVDVCVTKRMIVHQEGGQLHHQVGDKVKQAQKYNTDILIHIFIQHYAKFSQ